MLNESCKSIKGLRPVLELPLGGSRSNKHLLVKDIEYTISSKIHQNPSNGSEGMTKCVLPNICMNERNPPLLNKINFLKFLKILNGPYTSYIQRHRICTLNHLSHLNDFVQKLHENLQNRFSQKKSSKISVWNRLKLNNTFSHKTLDLVDYILNMCVHFVAIAFRSEKKYTCAQHGSITGRIWWKKQQSPKVSSKPSRRSWRSFEYEKFAPDDDQEDNGRTDRQTKRYENSSLEASSQVSLHKHKMQK